MADTTAAPPDEASPTKTWTAQRDERLMEWIDGHEFERNIIFSKAKAGHPRFSQAGTKSQCHIQAAKAVFSVDEDPEIRQAIENSTDFFATSTRNRMMTTWVRKYQKCNHEVGKEISNLRVEDIKDGTEAAQAIEAQLEEFPYWKRLHAYWRTLPHINLEYSIPEDEPKLATPPKVLSAASSKRRKLVIQRFAVPPEPDHEDPVSDSPAINPEANSSKSTPVSTYQPGNEEGSSSVVNKPKRGRKRKHSESALDDKVSDMFTPAQKHERALAELALKLQEKKNETELRRLELESEERRRIQEHKHEIMKMTLAMMGSPQVPDSST